MQQPTFVGPGRPRGDEALRRRAQFLILIADGMNADAAAVQARISFRTALRIVTETDFQTIVRTIRDSDQLEAVA